MKLSVQSFLGEFEEKDSMIKKKQRKGVKTREVQAGWISGSLMQMMKVEIRRIIYHV